MDDEKVKVYIKLNENGEVEDINSDVFLKDTSGYIKVDEGYGDKYVHAQGNYLDMPLVDLKEGKYNFKFDGINILKNQ